MASINCLCDYQRTSLGQKEAPVPGDTANVRYNPYYMGGIRQFALGWIKGGHSLKLTWVDDVTCRHGLTHLRQLFSFQS